MDLDLDTARTQYHRDGYCLAPPIIPAELIERVIPHMDAVLAGAYETGTPPYSRRWNPGDDPPCIRQIGMSHMADRTILELVTHPEIARWAAALVEAQRIQLFATQLLYKPANGQATGNIGWHQNKQYFSYWEGEVFTAWIAVSDVTEDAGPMRFVRGSHRWGLIAAISSTRILRRSGRGFRRRTAKHGRKRLPSCLPAPSAFIIAIRITPAVRIRPPVRDGALPSTSIQIRRGR